MLLALASLAVLPVRASGQDVERTPVAARDLSRGTVLEAEDITYGEPTPGLDGRRAARVGWVTRRVISQGEPLVEPAVAPPDLIRAGQVVQAVWSSGAVELRLRGEALGSAVEGERVMVRIDTHRRVEGVAVGPALVRIHDSI